MNLQHQRIEALCAQIKSARLHAEWGAIAQHAAREQASYADFLERVLDAEARARHERKVATLMKLATMPALKMLEQFDWKEAPGAPKAQIQELAHLAFVERAENASCCSAPVGWARRTSRWPSRTAPSVPATRCASSPPPT